MDRSINYNQKTKATYFIAGTAVSITLLSVLALHAIFPQFEMLILDFADHHYFLLAFITFLASMYCLKGYLEADIELNLKELKKKTIYFVVGLASSITILSVIILHFSLLQFEIFILDFAAHHYFLIAFAASLATMYCLKGYLNATFYLKSKKNVARILKQKQIKYDSGLINSIPTINEEDTLLIDKKKIGSLVFLNKDVLNTSEEITFRQNDLQKAMKLGNIYKQKVKIIFRDSSSQKLTETTVWHVDSSYVTLKGGILLPTKSIIKIII